MTNTANLNLHLNVIGSDVGTWGQDILDNWAKIDAAYAANTAVVTVGSPVSAAVDTAAIRAALLLGHNSPGLHVQLSPGTYKLNSKVAIYGQTYLEGVSFSDMTTAGSTGIGQTNGVGTTIQWAGTLATGRGMIEAGGFQTDSTAAERGVRISGICFDGAAETAGNAMVGWFARCRIWDCSFYRWYGTTAGTGRGLFLATTSSNDTGGGAVLLGGGENCFVSDCRFDTGREKVYVDSGGQQYTDGIFQRFEILKTTGGATSSMDPTGIADIYMQQAGGWTLRDIHTNGSLGDGLLINNATETTVQACYLDGFGCGAANATPGGQFSAINVKKLSSGAGGEGILIDTVIIRHRGIQNIVDSGNNQWTSINISPSSDIYDSYASILGCTSWRRYDSGVIATQGNPTTGFGNFFVQLNQAPSHSPSYGACQYLLVGNNIGYDPAGAVTAANSQPFYDGSVFLAPNGSTRITIYCVGNSFQQADTAPTVGYWPTGIAKDAMNPTTSTAYRFICTAGGTPGTWMSLLPSGTSTGLGVRDVIVASRSQSGVTEAVILSDTIPANQLAAGAVYHFRYQGAQANGSGAGAFESRVRYGTTTLTGTVIVSLTSPGSGANTANGQFVVEGWIICNDTTHLSAGVEHRAPGTTGIVGGQRSDEASSATPVSVVTSSTKLLEITAQNAASDSIAVPIGILERLK